MIGPIEQWLRDHFYRETSRGTLGAYSGHPALYRMARERDRERATMIAALESVSAWLDDESIMVPEEMIDAVVEALAKNTEEIVAALPAREEPGP